MTAEEREAAVEALRCDADDEACFDRAFDGGSDRPYDTGDPYWAAYDAVDAVLPVETPIATVSLEAAALLEDGWNPGDPVVRIGGAL